MGQSQGSFAPIKRAQRLRPQSDLTHDLRNVAPPWASEIAEIERRFAVDSALGLSVSDATERRQRDGDNVLEEAAPPTTQVPVFFTTVFMSRWACM